MVNSKLVAVTGSSDCRFPHKTSPNTQHSPEKDPISPEELQSINDNGDIDEPLREVNFNGFDKKYLAVYRPFGTSIYVTDDKVDLNNLMPLDGYFF